jgi:hypothetical protein
LLYHGTVNNATLSQGNTYWNNIKQDGDKILTAAKLGIGIDDPDVVSARLHAVSTQCDVLAESTTAGQSTRYRLKTTSREWRIGTFSGQNNNLWFYDASAGAYRLVLDPNGRCGIGTTSPSAKLHVKSASTDSWAVLATASDGSNLGGIYEAGDGAGVLVAKDAGGTNKVYLDGQGSSYINGGNLGIGTVSPWQALHVQSTGSQFSDGASGNNNYNVAVLDQNAYTSNYGGGILLGGKYNNAGNITTLGIVSASKVNGDGIYGGKVHIGGRENGTGNVPKVLTVTHANVGIGQVDPKADLHIGSSFNDAANDLGTAALAIKQTGTSAENGIYIRS